MDVGDRTAFIVQCAINIPVVVLLICLNLYWMFLDRDGAPNPGELPRMFRKYTTPLLLGILVYLSLRLAVATSHAAVLAINLLVDLSTFGGYALFANLVNTTVCNVILITKHSFPGERRARSRSIMISITSLSLISLVVTYAWGLLIDRVYTRSVFLASLPVYSIVILIALAWCIQKLRSHVQRLALNAAPTDTRFQQVQSSVSEFVRISLALVLVDVVAAGLQIYRIVSLLQPENIDTTFFSVESVAGTVYRDIDWFTVLKTVGFALCVYFARSKGSSSGGGGGGERGGSKLSSVVSKSLPPSSATNSEIVEASQALSESPFLRDASSDVDLEDRSSVDSTQGQFYNALENPR